MMSGLENSPVEICFFQHGSVEQVDAIVQAANLAEAFELVRHRYPEATFVACCENEPDGGCLFVYPNTHEQALDKQDAAAADTPCTLPSDYGRWVGVIASAERDEPTCVRPRSHI